MPQQPAPTPPTHPVANEPARYCRRCGYELRGLTTPRCPECGGGFDPADPKTFRRRPIPVWHWYAKRAAILLVTLVVLMAAVWGWFFWGWYDEQRVLAALKYRPEPYTAYTPIAPPWLSAHLGPAGFVFDRVWWINLDSRSDVTDLSPLCGLTEVRALSLSGTKVKDLSPLTRLTKLDELYLDGTFVMDFSPLCKLKSLRRVILPKETTTVPRSADLERALPDCSFERH